VLNVPLILSILVVRRWALSVLESSLCWRSIASVLLLRWCLLAIVIAALLWLLGMLAISLIVALCWSSIALTGRGRTVLVWLLLLAVALIILIVRSRHGRWCVGAVELGDVDA